MIGTTVVVIMALRSNPWGFLGAKGEEAAEGFRTGAEEAEGTASRAEAEGIVWACGAAEQPRG